MEYNIERAQLERKMSANNCSASDFKRLSEISPSLCSEGFERLGAYMNGAKALASIACGAIGYFAGSYLAQQLVDDNFFPKIVGGLTALVAAKLIAKPAARVGLDLGLRI
ncbi:MAG: hypothetical protein WCI72_00070 [archaeon]